MYQFHNFAASGPGVTPGGQGWDFSTGEINFGIALALGWGAAKAPACKRKGGTVAVGGTVLNRGGWAPLPPITSPLTPIHYRR
jgi:hypothetical protein